MRWVAATALVLLTALSMGVPRATAERKFLAGRLEDLPLVLDGARTAQDRLPLILAAHWWRRTPGAAAADSVQPDDLASRRVAWARAGLFEPPYPLAGSGGAEAEPYPLLRALIEDRIRRETQGAKGLPEEGPLAAYLKAPGRTPTREETWDLKNTMRMMIRSYRGDRDPAEEFRSDRRARALHDQNRLIYLTSLAALMVLSFVGLLVVSRTRA